jgi:phosphoenolpyruvate---glycerone phosphotransferase subunit DhaM
MSDTPTVGVVLISHSRLLAEGAAEVAAQVAANGVSIVGVGGTEDGRLGTSIDALARAIDKVAAGVGVVVIPDLGSSVLTSRSYLSDHTEFGHTELPDDVRLVDTAFVEGAVAAAVAASTGASLGAVVAAAEEARDVRKF